MNLYFLSGLGADKRVFQHLVLPEHFRLIYIEWIPVSRDMTLAAYCELLRPQIDETQSFTLIGLSFGGVVAVELSKRMHPAQTVMISSFCHKQEVPRFYTLIGKLRLYRLLPTWFLLKPNKFIYRMFGAKGNGIARMLKSILQDTDPQFFRWAINQLFTWDNDWQPRNFLRLHGTNDRVLPYNSNMHAIVVEGGSHLMVYSRAEEVSKILTENLVS